MSDTLNNPNRFKDCPRTKVWVRLGLACEPDYYYVSADLVGELERELTLAQSELASCRQQAMMDTECIERIRNEAMKLESEVAKLQALNKSKSDMILLQQVELARVNPENARLRADADRKTAMIVELREKLVTARQQLHFERCANSVAVVTPDAVPSPVCRHCGKVESEHGMSWKWCDMTMSSEVFTPISPEPISTEDDGQRQEPMDTIEAVAKLTDERDLWKGAVEEWKDQESIRNGDLHSALAAAQERVVELERTLEAHAKGQVTFHAECKDIAKVLHERDSALMEVAELKTQLAVAGAGVAELKREFAERESLYQFGHSVDQTMEERSHNINEGETKLDALCRWSLERVQAQTERDTLRTQLDLAQRQIAANAVALKPVYDQLCALKMSHPNIVHASYLDALKAVITAELAGGAE